jgi:hypothetical protein
MERGKRGRKRRMEREERERGEWRECVRRYCEVSTVAWLRELS